MRYETVRTDSRSSSGWALLLCCSLLGAACSDRGGLDGSSPAAFTQSVPKVARALPAAERQEFMANLTAVALANGSPGIEEPSLATLVALDGATPAAVKAMAQEARRAQERQWVEQQLRLAEQALDAVSKRLEFGREQLRLAEEAEATLRRVVVSEVTASSMGHGRAELRFQVKNGNAFAVEIRGVELDVLRVAGPSETLGSLAMLSVSTGCLYGQRLGPAGKAPGVCAVSLKYEPGARYALRVVEVHVPGQPLRMSSFGDESAQRVRVQRLEDEAAAKRQAVERLKFKLTSDTPR